MTQPLAAGQILTATALNGLLSNVPQTFVAQANQTATTTAVNVNGMSNIPVSAGLYQIFISISDLAVSSAAVHTVDVTTPANTFTRQFLCWAAEGTSFIGTVLSSLPISFGYTPPASTGAGVMISGAALFTASGVINVTMGGASNPAWTLQGGSYITVTRVS